MRQLRSMAVIAARLKRPTGTKVRRSRLSVVAAVSAIVLAGLSVPSPAFAYVCNTTWNSNAAALYQKPYYYSYNVNGTVFHMQLSPPPNNTCSSTHTGTDWDLADSYAGQENTYPILAMTSGTIIGKTDVNQHAVYGKYLVINAESDTNEYAYAHASSWSAGSTLDAYVGKGQVLGYSGATGSPVYVHLHVTMTMDWNGWGTGTTYFDPKAFLASKGVVWLTGE